MGDRLSTPNWKSSKGLLVGGCSETSCRRLLGDSARGGLDLELPLLPPELQDPLEDVDSCGVCVGLPDFGSIETMGAGTGGASCDFLSS